MIGLADGNIIKMNRIFGGHHRICIFFRSSLVGGSNNGFFHIDGRGSRQIFWRIHLWRL